MAACSASKPTERERKKEREREREREFFIEVLSQQNLVDPWACSLGMTKCHLEQMHRKVRVVDVFLHEGLN